MILHDELFPALGGEVYYKLQRLGVLPGVFPVALLHIPLACYVLEHGKDDSLVLEIFDSRLDRGFELQAIQSNDVLTQTSRLL